MVGVKWKHQTAGFSESSTAKNTNRIRSKGDAPATYARMSQQFDKRYEPSY